MDRAIGEYRIDWGPGYRIYVGKDGDALIILLGGGTKRRQTGGHPAGGGDVGGIQGAEDRNGKVARQGVKKMALTRDFKETIVARVRRDPEFANALLDEAATLFLNGEADAARLVLRDLVNATVGFEALASETAKPAKSLHRMLSKNGNPTMDNLAAILGVVRRRLGVEMKAQTVEGVWHGATMHAEVEQARLRLHFQLAHDIEGRAGSAWRHSRSVTSIQL